MDLGLAGRTALVCGGSRGIGAAIAASLAQEGAQVAVAARDSESLRDTASQLGAAAIPVDLTTPDGPHFAVDRAVGSLGSLDLLVVNSGGPPPGDFQATDERAWEIAIQGTLLYALRLLRAALPVLGRSPVPSILVVLSSSVREPIPGLITSNVLRPGLAGLIKSLVTEIAPIRINGIAPGRIGTERVAQLDEWRATSQAITIEELRRSACARIPLARYGEPFEIGSMAAFLLSPAASYITGTVVPIDGGMITSLP